MIVRFIITRVAMPEFLLLMDCSPMSHKMIFSCHLHITTLLATLVLLLFYMLSSQMLLQIHSVLCNVSTDTTLVYLHLGHSSLVFDRYEVTLLLCLHIFARVNVTHLDVSQQRSSGRKLQFAGGLGTHEHCVVGDDWSDSVW